MFVPSPPCLTSERTALTFDTRFEQLARDTARLMVPFGVEIIAANSDGLRKKDYGVRSCLLSPPASSFADVQADLV